jgi:hypothetical protein
MLKDKPKGPGTKHKYWTHISRNVFQFEKFKFWSGFRAKPAATCRATGCASGLISRKTGLVSVPRIALAQGARPRICLGSLRAWVMRRSNPGEFNVDDS